MCIYTHILLLKHIIPIVTVVLWAVNLTVNKFRNRAESNIFTVEYHISTMKFGLKLPVAMQNKILKIHKEQ